MGPESILIFSLSVLVICGNSGIHANTAFARKNLHGDARAARRHLDPISRNDNGPYKKEADPKAASIASVAADASLDITESMAKEISDAIALAVANAVAKVLDEQAAQSEQNSEQLSNDTPTASDEANGNVKDDLKLTDLGHQSERIESEVAYENDDKKPVLADNTSKFSMIPDADQSKIKRTTFSDDQAPASNQDVQRNPIANYRRAGIIILQHRNSSRPIYHERINARRHNHRFIHETRDDDYDDDAL